MRSSYLLLLLIFLSFRSYAQSSIQVYTLKDTVFILPDTPSILVLSQTRACLNCYAQIRDFLQSDSLARNFQVYILMHDTGTAVNRKHTQNVLRSYFKDDYPYYYTSRKNALPADSFLGREIRPGYFPGLIILKGGKRHVFSYGQLFEEGLFQPQPIQQIIQSSE